VGILAVSPKSINGLGKTWLRKEGLFFCVTYAIMTTFLRIYRDCIHKLCTPKLSASSYALFSLVNMPFDIFSSALTQKHLLVAFTFIYKN